MIIKHGLRSLLDLALALALRHGDRSRQTPLDTGDLVGFATDLAHDAGAGQSLCAASTCEVEGAAGVVPVAPFRARGALSREQLALDNLARVLLPVLLDPSHGVLERQLALLDGAVMVLLVLLPHLVPLAWVLGLVGLGAELEGEVLLDELQPYLARAAVDLGGVELDAAQLICIFDLEQNVTNGVVREVVADAVELADVLDAGQGRQVDKRADRHGET